MGIKLLIAEDNEMNQKLIQIILNKNGYTHTLAIDGQEAFKKFKDEKFDMILMDCQMPVMDGLTAAQLIRTFESENQITRTPIIALTANSMKGDREKCLAAGMDDFVSKPFKMGQILDVIKTWIPTK